MRKRMRLLHVFQFLGTDNQFGIGKKVHIHDVIRMQVAEDHSMNPRGIDVIPLEFLFQHRPIHPVTGIKNKILFPPNESDGAKPEIRPICP
jgi:hypothetical protein